MADVQVAVGHTIRPWRGELQRYARDFVTGVQIQVYRDSRAIQAAHFDALLLDASSSLLDGALMAHCAERQIPVAAVYDRRDDADGSERARIKALGVSIVDPSTLDDLLVTFSRRGPLGRETAAAGPIVAPAERDGGSGYVVAVGGPGGAGTTEVGVGLASAFAKTGRTILVDIDEVRPSVARRLGLTLAPHVVNAADEVGYLWESASATELNDQLSAQLARPAVANPKGLPFDVIAGLPTGADWPSLQPERLANLVTVLRRVYAVTILRLGPSLEDLGRWVDRFGVSRRGAAVADRIVSVADGSPTGIAESVDWLAELRDVTTTPVDLVVNRVPSGKFRQAELAEVLEQAVGSGIASVNTVRFDKTLPDRSWFGDLPTKGVAFKDISSIVGQITRPEKEPLPPPPVEAEPVGLDAVDEVVDLRAAEPAADAAAESR